MDLTGTSLRTLAAAVVAWLASDEARHVTGIQLPVDLGRTNR
jgi:hypothetical protein